MGGSRGGGFLPAGNILAANHDRLSQKFPLDGNGRFGFRDVGKNQVVISENPTRTAREFFKKLSSGSTVSPLENKKGLRGQFDDGSVVIYRPTSTDGSPAVSIKVFGATGYHYKIHFQSLSYRPRRK